MIHSQFLRRFYQILICLRKSYSVQGLMFISELKQSSNTLKKICQRTALGNRSPAMPKGLQEKVFSIRGSTFPFFLSSDKLALKPWAHGLLWRALHATDCKGYTHTLAFVEFSLIIKGRNNITEEWSMILWELFSPQLWLSLRGFLKLHSWGFITTGVIQRAIEWG